MGQFIPQHEQEGGSGRDAQGGWSGVVGDAGGPCLGDSVFLGDSEVRSQLMVEKGRV